LANAALAGQVTGAAEWHINADEPMFLDYNLERKSPAQRELNAATPFRSSDHDPLLVGLNLVPDVSR
jgi:predicted extracellular nuclease